MLTKLTQFYLRKDLFTLLAKQVHINSHVRSYFVLSLNDKIYLIQLAILSLLLFIFIISSLSEIVFSFFLSLFKNLNCQQNKNIWVLSSFFFISYSLSPFFLDWFIFCPISKLSVYLTVFFDYFLSICIIYFFLIIF